MSALTPDRFEEFITAVYSRPPFPWQTRLAARVCGGDWPRAIALPTAAGKTACIDIAVFALACGGPGRQPRRIFFVVDRRIVVDQAHRHATDLANGLGDADDGILCEVADALRELAAPGWCALARDDRHRILRKQRAVRHEKEGVKRRKLLAELADDERAWFDVGPLNVFALRGGMYRETAWARSPLQPTVIASTVDQVGSRLLFRGYGVSDSMKPVHAGLVGNDALILLDEAHCAKPFDQTVKAVERYRAWADEPTAAPFTFVSVTATPTGEVPEEAVFKADDADHAHEVLGKRLTANKPAKLVVADKAKGKKWREELVKVLAERARALAKPGACVGIIVNRVATARDLAKALRNDTVLLTGRMRPLDRDRIFDEKLRPLLSGEKGLRPKFVVGTQCLECGADFDFDALVTECASLDALRQRFGRLNRIAARDKAPAVVVVRADQTEPAEKESDRDPVYDNALAHTWKWLSEKATDGAFDFGVSAVAAATAGVELGPLSAPAVDAPVLFPAHLDCWVQTHPIPCPDPDPAVFLHGPKRQGQPDVQVVFRADLGENPEQWAEIVGLCPPSSSEAVAVPIGVFKKWLAGETAPDDTSDVEGGVPEEADEGAEPAAGRVALRWRGSEESEKKTGVVSAPGDVTPSDTYVVPVPATGDEGGLRALQQIADLGEVVTDDGERAFLRSRDRAILRFTPRVVETWPGAFCTAGARELATGAGDAEDRDEFAERLDEVLDELAAIDVSADGLREWVWLRDAARALARTERERKRARVTRREVLRHPLGGVVLVGMARLHQFDPTYLDDSEPGESFVGRRASGRAVVLEEHSRGVAAHAARFAAGCGLDAGLFTQAGLWHDVGKLDPRFQAMLRGSSPRTAVGEPLAKSGRPAGTRAEQEQLRAVHGYPKGARHELLSAALVAARAVDGGADDLLLHLIATHHGSGRPFASAVDDPPGEVAAVWPFAPKLFDEVFPAIPYRQDVRGWNAELPERFWRVVRRWGWWGAAYREAVFRLADHAQSAAEQERDAAAPEVATGWVALPAVAVRAGSHVLPLTALDGSNPLAFLAALGTLRLASRAFPEARMSWEARGYWTPVLHFGGAVTREELTAELLAHAAPTRRCLTFSQDIKIPAGDYRAFEWEACRGGDREFGDFLTSYANPLVTIQGGPNAGRTKPTELYFLAGQQRLLRQAQEIARATTAEAVTRALFEPWRYDDPLDGLSLRWDPRDDLRYATRFTNPSKDRTKGKRGSVLGANRLAFEALPLFPCFARGTRLVTTGFAARERRTYFTWPLWMPAWSVDTVRSILATEIMRGEIGSVKHDALVQRGVTACCACDKVSNSDYSNFTPSRVV